MTMIPARADSRQDAILLRSDEAGITTLTLNRPAERNSLSCALLERLQEELDLIAEDAAVRVVIIAAHGPAFCAGHDIKELRVNPGRAHYEASFAQSNRVMKSIVGLLKPVIARVQGLATAAGCQLVANCDLAIAGERAMFCTPGVNIGLFCSTPMVPLSRDVPRKIAMEMLLTGEAIDAARAAEIGLINRVVPDATLERETTALAAQIASKSPVTLGFGKQAFYRQIELSLSEAYDYASAVMTRNMLAKDAEEGLDAFLEKRRPVWRGQ
jgi:enoyl-CoA hydratase/carnithine racemase